MVLDLGEPIATDDQSSLYFGKFGTRQFLFFTTDDNFGSADDRFGNSQGRKFEVTCRFLLFLGIFLALAALFFVILTIILIGCETEPPQQCYWRYGRPF